jgi:mRNA interferase HicA
MKRLKLLRHLAQHGCCLHREGGKHSIWRNPANERKVPVPRHAEIVDRTALRICEQLGIPGP